MVLSQWLWVSAFPDASRLRAPVVDPPLQCRVQGQHCSSGLHAPGPPVTGNVLKLNTPQTSLCTPLPLMWHHMNKYPLPPMLQKRKLRPKRLPGIFKFAQVIPRALQPRPLILTMSPCVYLGLDIGATSICTLWTKGPATSEGVNWDALGKLRFGGRPVAMGTGQLGDEGGQHNRIF